MQRTHINLSTPSLILAGLIIAFSTAMLINSAIAQENSETTNASEKRPEIFCHDQVFVKRITRIDIDFNKNARTFFEISPNSFIAEKDDIDLVSFQDILQNLPSDRWKTPQAIWPIQSVKVNIKVNGISACKVIYTQNKLYTQYKELNGFIMQPISITTFHNLNKILFSQTTV